MTILAYLLTAVLLTIACLHLMWAIGWWFPLGDERRLARAVVGARGIERMPGAIACSLVVVALLGVASAIWWPDTIVRTLALWVSGAVFLLRGVIAYIPAFRRFGPEEPFATLDKSYYAPLCLVLGVGIWALAT
ncbi:DUF3995 domain-containing protein [Frigidibacter sp. RF13]|uniref:DUF3995 domain-containing protein n=1 Tax=Frigidibacter sp. RF13 TaxID=2997340 RepID=UPI00226EF919|nr:DUF3995 domain-containing protein [Frigidibacter sp. RF13]MCY1126061.1 DUF3995 domain-containing protein [Frigidibacter sp. RF13]